ncbi:hypothetical protein CBR_g37742 [Chara braunii]|uniref:Rieske domain-containing protein n=1 Tax=Chara braunii TaxID=69332 RepID=A0A388LNT1_CHABU|nr:hypothetical protein CBR_g37742 [Chara braunii]|eukprot:GBG83872.1 hypothetical protein CBR_g37742 [Chara braunii]
MRAPTLSSSKMTWRFGDLSWEEDGESSSQDVFFVAAGPKRTRGGNSLSPVIRGAAMAAGAFGSHANKPSSKVTAPAMATETPAASGLDEQNADVANEEPSFQWSRHWYGVAVEAQLDRRQPHAITVLGRRFVLWWDRSAQEQDATIGVGREETEGGNGGGAGALSKADYEDVIRGGMWRAFLDQCPHRLAPLSEGRIDEEGRLQCSYHGWSFGGDGGCKNIPQDRPERQGSTSPRACATAVPTGVVNGVLFLWPDESAEGVELASKTPLPVDPAVHMPGLLRRERYVREVPYGYEILVENLFDPSHLSFAHHAQGTMMYRQKGAPLDLEASSKGREGFVGQGWDTTLRPGMFYVEFQAASRVTHRREWNIGGRDVTAMNTFYVTPSEPGRSLLIIGDSFTHVPDTEVSVGSLMRKLHQAIRTKMNASHLFLNAFLDGDSYLLHVAEKNLNRMKMQRNKEWNEAYYLPTASDRWVIAFRQWLHKYAGGGVKWATGATSPAPRTAGATGSPDKDVDKIVDEAALTVLSPREALDRYHQHTAKCQACLRLLNFYRTLQKALCIACVLLVSIAACLSGQTVPPIVASSGANGPMAATAAAVSSSGGKLLGVSLPLVIRVVLAILSVGAAIGALKLEDYIQNFIYKGYNHALVP